jgi:uncharacterized protein (TIGR02996 family)
MAEDASLFEAILAVPEDDAPRLIYADWLEEHGDTARAEFIRLQCALAQLPLEAAERLPLVSREQELLAEHGSRWGGVLPGLVHSWSYHRGFIDRVTCDAARFLALGEGLFRLTPLQHLHLRGARGSVAELHRMPVLERLRTLDLAHSRIGDAAVQHLAHSPHIARLTTLDLTRNRIGRGGARALVLSPHLTSLEALLLRDNPNIPAPIRQSLQRRFGTRVQF